MRYALAILSFASPLRWSLPLEAEMIWLEAEQFQQPGGWTNDAQFIDQMGSPYLMAIGLGTPVEKRTHRFSVFHGGPLPTVGSYKGLGAGASSRSVPGGTQRPAD